MFQFMHELYNSVLIVLYWYWGWYKQLLVRVVRFLIRRIRTWCWFRSKANLYFLSSRGAPTSRSIPTNLSIPGAECETELRFDFRVNVLVSKSNIGVSGYIQYTQRLFLWVSWFFEVVRLLINSTKNCHSNILKKHEVSAVVAVISRHWKSCRQQ